MKDRPILFSGPMIRAILDGRKSQTRRIVRLPGEKGIEFHGDIDVWADTGGGVWEAGECHQGPIASVCHVRCPYGVPGDRLWCRETWNTQVGSFGESRPVVYRATDDERHGPWRPSIFMPRWASRITLEVVSVRVERLQEITEEDAKAEGVELAVNGIEDIGGGETRPTKSFRQGFVYAWNEINAKRGPWASNPWVWVISFRREGG